MSGTCKAAQREWNARYSAAEAEQRLELMAQLESGVLAKSSAEFLEAAALAAELYDDSTGYHVFRVGTMSSEVGQGVRHGQADLRPDRSRRRAGTISARASFRWRS